MSDSQESAGASRWLVAVLILGLSGWTAFTIYERLVKPAPTAQPQPAKDDRLEGFVEAGRNHLDKGELTAAKEEYTRASALADADPRVLEGLALVRVSAAEQTWWNLTFGKHDQAQRVGLLRELSGEVEKAREAVAKSIDKATDLESKSRLKRARQRLDAMLVVALALHGDEERARGTLTSRLAEHPQRKMLADFVAMVGKPRPETEPDAGEDDTEDAGPGPLAATRSPEPAPKPTSGRHYEFNEEPASGMPKTPGELEFTVGKEKVEKKVVSPEPAPVE